jgi:hypothetical protein
MNVYSNQKHRPRRGMLVIFMFWVFCGLTHANGVESIPDSPHFLPTDAPDARWVFSGVVSNEQGVEYGYFFQMDRRDHAFHSRSALFDVQTKAIILQDESDADITAPSLNRWQVGHAFLHFNPINDSWVFGFKQGNKAGFNFKVDMLGSSERLPVEQGLRPGISVLVSQAHLLNGHINVPQVHEEYFVTAKHAWFRQMSVTESQRDAHAIKGVLCRFGDGSGFYSVNLPEADALRGAMSGRFDAEGLALPISQFIHVESLEEGRWAIRVPSPRESIFLSSSAALLQQPSVIAGVAEVGDKTGFCFVSEDEILGGAKDGHANA